MVNDYPQPHTAYTSSTGKQRFFKACAVAVALAFTCPTLSLAEPVSQQTAADKRISVTIEGQGPDIILIPGVASSRDVWSGLAKQLSETHRLHLVQIAGFAGQPAITDQNNLVAAPAAEAINEYIQRQQLTAPVIIGHSLGGEVALMIAARHPERVGRVMVVDALPFYSLLFSPDATVAAVKPRADAFHAAMMAAPDNQAEAMQSAAIARLVKDETARPALIRAGLQSDKQTVADATRELMTTDLRPELHQITAPVAIVYAWDSLYGIPAVNTDATYRNAYALLPGVKLRRIDNSFHFVMLDQPEQFAHAVNEFIGQ